MNRWMNGQGLPVLLALLLASGCASTRRIEPLQTSFTLEQPDCGIPGRSVAAETLAPEYADLIAGGRINAVLGYERLGLKAYRLRDYCVAAAAFDEAVRIVGGIIADDADAARARSLFGKEASKVFKGEPYERSMLYLYRGLLYYQAGEYDNARACFRSGQILDAHAEEDPFRADYAILDYLEGKADLKYGKPAEDSFEAARSHVPGRRHIPSTDPENNLLVLIESGLGPVKFAGGGYGEALYFERGRPGGDRVALFVDGNQAAAANHPTEDVFYQATTRGGREIDHILAGQARFKAATDTAGDVMLFGGTAMALHGRGENDKDLKYAGLGVVIGGLLAKSMSAGARPEADVRRWDNLPERIHAFSLRVKPGVHTIRAEVFTDGSKTAEVFQENVLVPDEEGREKMILLTALPREFY